MVDIVDRAQAHEQQLNEDALKKVQQRLVGQQPSESCRGCGDDIDAERRAAQPNASRCVECEERRERQSRMFFRRVRGR